VVDTGASVRVTRRYAAAPAEVWAALTEPESVSRWLGSPHDATWRAAEVLEVEPERVLELDWRRPGEEPSIVRVELRAEGDDTILVLDHRRLEAEVCMGYMAAWSRALDRFEAA
jgi:uncharacterized protein YndB with AHSA1/START domain